MKTPNKKTGFFSILSQTTPSQKLLIFFLLFLFSCSGILSVCLALFFKEPLIYCIDPKTNIPFECSEQTACTHNYPFSIDKTAGPHSFSSQYELICEASSQKRLALTCIFFGYLLAAIMQTIYIIKASQRRSFIVMGGYFMSIGYFFMLLVNWLEMNFINIAWLFLAPGFGSVIVITYAYIFVNEHFKGELCSVLIIMLDAAWGVSGISFSFLGFFVKCDWRIILGLASMIIFVCSSYLCFSKDNSDDTSTIQNNGEIDEEDEEDVKEEHFNIFSYFRDLWKNPIIRNNFLIYTLTWGIYMAIYICQYVELECVGGSVYFNNFFLCCLELSSTLLGGFITRKYNCNTILHNAINIVIILFLCFMFAPISIREASGFQVTFFVVCLLLSKLANDLVNLMIYLSLPKMFTDKYVALFIIISRGFSRILLIFLPTLNYIIRSWNIHPFVFYGVWFILCRILLFYCKEVQPDGGIDELMNDANIGNLQRTAILSASHSMAGALLHDDILKKIKVDGVQLSVIRKYKQNPNSIKLGSAIFNLPTPLLKSIHCSKSMHQKEGNLYEMKERLLISKQLENH